MNHATTNKATPKIRVIRDADECFSESEIQIGKGNNPRHPRQSAIQKITRKIHEIRDSERAAMNHATTSRGTLKIRVIRDNPRCR